LLRFVFIFLLLTASSFGKTVISLSPAITEIIYFVGGGKELVGDTIFCNYPEDAKRKEKVGGIVNPDIEKILTIKPDLVIASSLTPERVIRRLRKLKLRVVKLKLSSIEDVADAIEMVGNLLGRDGKERRREFLEELEREEGKLSRCIKGKRVIFLISSKPAYTCGNSTYIGYVIRRAGGVNVAGDGEFFPISVEQVVSRKPDVVIVAASGSRRRSIAELLRRLNLRFTVLNPDDILRPSPRLLRGIEEMRRRVCRQFQ